ncbi:eukaryotic translation initiation factor 2-alpha kinase 1-like [Schistocerca cancellata]|uniref:eukaryotic translation initiation factor 2-alpha kinase 1-like n=1 Tax=Schistocerca cancellata TaxID=274614 RepID=UPI00211840F9|nr:eukaryotic translation initiation factor 2-alpha kinase 1-like [Schistocerca cancellata]
MDAGSHQQGDDEDDVLPSLQTVTNFDDGNGDVPEPTDTENGFCFEDSPVVASRSLIRPEVTRLAGEDDAGLVVEAEFPSQETSFLIESLVKQLCKFVEKNTTKQRALYDAICRILYKLKLIDGTYAIEELEFMRNRYVQAVWDLLQIAKIGNEPGANNRLISVARKDSFKKALPSKLLVPEKLFESSRYQTEFVELEYIAHGGFGYVYKARNKLDGGEYAIKKICLRYHRVDNFLKSLQEVKLLAKLHHPNIVAYKAAWLEPFQQSSNLDCQSSITDDSLSTSLNDASDGMSPSSEMCNGQRANYALSGNATCSSSSQSSASESHEQVSHVSASHMHLKSKEKSYDSADKCSSKSTSTESSEDKAICVPSHLEEITCKNLKRLIPPERDCATLYIQMQLCDQTLLQWLNNRNNKRIPIDITQCLKGFRHLVCGIEYIHSQGIVHHDIKPSNIFVNSELSQVQVGDFGLACFLQHSHKDVALLSQPTLYGDHRNMEIGTKTYAAPEQLEGVCNQKSDLYSLGIVLFELLQPCYTDMEKSILIKDLKDGAVSQELCAAAPELVEMMIHLTSCSLDRRPTSKELLAQLDYLSCHNTNESSVIKHLLSEISQRDKEIEELKHEKRQYAQEILELKLKLERYETLDMSSKI